MSTIFQDVYQALLEMLSFVMQFTEDSQSK